ncbi:FAD:protein FMN transferase [Streptococcus iniae]|nr:FAD:protein FMN transferase [Streptococcus iniae]WHL22505.1 FAD:protein FMN transferase [Streptococcus iniae]WHL24693.1 FAD:protein FMN transferase [Streptococcus iniae]WLR88770.1 FAD:protein FMN transferase [Streptococcus iniae]WLR90694.1 FAD:protein FMN transferase [Streptococcus iniae]WNZ89188.1 FAD:protein FMN transferase [Streptococcus iniae]
MQTKELRMMGTVITIQIESDKASRQIETVCQLLETYNHRFSANDEDSELMQINHMAGIEEVSVHPDLYQLIKVGKEHSLSEPSNLNIAIGPLVQSWRIGFSDATVPESSTVLEKLKKTAPQKILLNDQKKTVLLEEKEMKIDLGALAKGYIADKVLSYLIEDGIDSALINLGGNVLVHGKNPKRQDGLFYIGIQHPVKTRGQNIGIIKTENMSVVTSGIYERHLSVNGKDYHHIFDRKTGYPIETDMTSLTIVAKSSLDCEIWTTRLFGLPSLTVYNLLNASPDIDGIIITKDQKIVVSDGLKTSFQLVF